MMHVTFKPLITYIRRFDQVFLDMDLTHLTPGLPYALRLLGFDLSLPL